VGGVASIWGAPFGAAAVLLITPLLRELFRGTSAAASGIENILYGLALVVIMIFLPQGLLTGAGSWWSYLWNKIRGGRKVGGSGFRSAAADGVVAEAAPLRASDEMAQPRKD